MDLRVGLGMALLITSSLAFAETSATVDSNSRNGLVEVEYPVESLLPYRDRRPKNQLTFNFQYENFEPNGFISPSYNTTYAQTYQSKATPILSATLGWKHNVSFAGLELAATYGNGGLSDTQQGETVRLDITKTALKFGVYLDTLFQEPYVVPYANMQLVQWDIHETSPELSFSKNTAYAMGIQVGALIQLNGLEPESSMRALNDTGLTNTYLDIFAQQYGNTADSSDPKLATDFNWGLGFRVEY